MIFGFYIFLYWVFYGVNIMLFNEYCDDKKYFFLLIFSLIIDIILNIKINI